MTIRAKLRITDRQFCILVELAMSKRLPDQQLTTSERVFLVALLRKKMCVRNGDLWTINDLGQAACNSYSNHEEEIRIAKLHLNAKNPAAVSLGRRGGLKGGKARAAVLSPERRSEIASNAAKVRWDKNEIS